MTGGRLDWQGERAIARVRAARREALNAGSAIIRSDAILRCPVDTGQLRNSIQKVVSEESAIVGSNVEYAVYVEYGTSRQQAQPFMRPALDENIDEIKRIMQQVLEEALR